MKITMHPVTYTDMWRWTRKEMDKFQATGIHDRGMTGTVELDGQQRRLDVRTDYPDKETVTIQCSMGEFRTMLNKMMKQGEKTS
jgi:hypothetical protein